MIQFKSLAAAVLAAPVLFGACAWAAASSPVSPHVAPASTATKAAAAIGPTAAAGDAQAKALFESACSSCHDTSVVTQLHQTPDQWANTVDLMVSRGAPLDSNEAAEISDYLAKHYS